jgi:membrane-associated phospholipid phosphatase
VRRRPVLLLLIGVAAAAVVFTIVTIVVTVSPSLAVDSNAFDAANELRAPWLDHAARVITSLGRFAIVGPVVLLGAALLFRRHYRVRAAALVVGAALAWLTVWLTKWAVDRPRPPRPLVHTAGPSYPSGHAANSVGWLALGITLTVLIPNRGGRVTVIACGALLTALVGLSRIYLRAHYASDVLAGEALAAMIYALAAIGALAWQEHREAAGKMTTSPPNRCP